MNWQEKKQVLNNDPDLSLNSLMVKNEIKSELVSVKYFQNWRLKVLKFLLGSKDVLEDYRLVLPLSKEIYLLFWY